MDQWLNEVGSQKASVCNVSIKVLKLLFGQEREQFLRLKGTQYNSHHCQQQKSQSREGPRSSALTSRRGFLIVFFYLLNYAGQRVVGNGIGWHQPRTAQSVTGSLLSSTHLRAGFTLTDVDLVRSLFFQCG